MADSHLKNQLKNVIIRDIKETGIVIGCGAYGEVLKMEMKGKIVAGKRMHNRLMEAENEGVSVLVTRFEEECLRYF